MTQYQMTDNAWNEARGSVVEIRTTTCGVPATRGGLPATPRAAIVPAPGKGQTTKTHRVALRMRCDPVTEFARRRRFLAEATAIRKRVSERLARAARFGVVSGLLAGLMAPSLSASVIPATVNGGAGLTVNSSSVTTPSPGNDNVPGLSPNTLVFNESVSSILGGGAQFSVANGPPTEYSVTLTVLNNTAQEWSAYTLHVGGGTIGTPIATNWFLLDTDLPPTISGPGTAYAASVVTNSGNMLNWSNLSVPVAGTVVFKFNLDLPVNSSGTWQIQQLPGACVTPPTGMVAWYPGDDTTPYDERGQHPGTFVGSPISSSEWKVGGGALAIFPPDTYVTVANAPDLNFGTGDFSIDMWIKTTSTTAIPGIQPILDKRTASPTVGYHLALFNGYLLAQLADGIGAGSTNYFDTGNPGLFVADGQWHFVAVTVDRPPGSNLVLYVDGNSEAFSPAARPGSLDNTSPLLIGARKPSLGGGTFDGLLDEVEFFNRALAQSEVAGIYQAGSAGKCKCHQPEVEICYAGGRDELCAMTAPNDPTHRSACLNAAYPAAPWKNFDDMSSNRFIGNTFDNLPRGITGASLEICMKPHSDIPSNDSINLCLNTCNPPAWAWSSAVQDLPGNGGTWNNGDACQCFTLDLSALPNTNSTFTDILSCINAKGALDVLVQDDSAIDSMSLDVTVCPCAKPIKITRLAGLVDNFAANPLDPACFRSAPLSAIRPDWVCFDTPPSDDGVGYTFKNLPKGIISATFDACMRADSSATNDSINLELKPQGGPAQFVWGSAIASRPEAGGTWNTGQTATFNLDLSTLPPVDGSCSNIVGALGDRTMDVYVQDDTEVDYFRLRMLACPRPGHLYHFGMDQGPLGQAALAVDPANNLVVSNIGSSGEDGVEIELGDAGHWHAEWLDLNGGAPTPVGQSIGAVIFGEVNGETDETLVSAKMTQTAQGPELLADFIAIGATTYTIRKYSQGALVEEVRNIPSGIPHVLGATCTGSCPCTTGCICNGSNQCVSPPPPCGGWTDMHWNGTYASISGHYIPCDFVTAGGVAVASDPSTFDLVSIIPDDPAVAYGNAERVEIKLANAPSMTIISEAVELSGLPVHTLGDAVFGSARDSLTISNIVFGNAGNDGVSIDVGETESFNLHWAPIDPAGDVPNGAFLQVESQGSVGGNPDHAVGTLRVTDVGSDYEITADYSAVGSTSQQVLVLDHGVLVATANGHTGPVAHVPQWPSGCGKGRAIVNGGATACYFPEWPTNVAIAIVGGPTVMGNELRVLAENPSAPFDLLQSFSVVASDIPEITFTGADLPLSKGDDDTCIGGANAGQSCAQNSDCPGGACHLKNRFITAVVPVTANAHGIKVTVVNLDANSAATPGNYNGTARWVGPPSVDVSDGITPSFNAARLQCAYFSADWNALLASSTEGMQLHIYGDVVVPGSTYDASVCSAEAGPCSAPLRLATAKFGDVIAPVNTTNFQDVNSVVAKFQGTPAGPSKTRTKLTGSTVNPSNPINFQEVSACVAAFQGKAFKTIVPAPPATCP